MKAKTLKPIAFLESCYEQKFATPRQGRLAPHSFGRIRLNEDQSSAGLQGLELYTHLWLIGDFHLAEPRASAKVRPPRWRGQKLGVWATRSPHRPNSLSLSVVKIEKIQGRDILVSGLDLVDGTPIYDLKPYIPSYDRVNGARSPEAPGAQRLKVKVSAVFQKRLKTLVLPVPRKIFLAAAKESLREDPRPSHQRQADEEKIFGMWLGGWNLSFKIKGSQATLLDITPKHQQVK